MYLHYPIICFSQRLIPLHSTNLPCVCMSTVFQVATVSCLQSSCSAADQQAAVALQKSLCTSDKPCPDSLVEPPVLIVPSSCQFQCGFNPFQFRLSQFLGQWQC